MPSAKYILQMRDRGRRHDSRRREGSLTFMTPTFRETK
ncbi:hypothetical protein C7S13_5203 [Burkholderia cepacia]|nr:hypothetical protein [Burkholderia cepacia]MDW9248954.1 hypothetical protein [Burkholderia cepacia]